MIWFYHNVDYERKWILSPLWELNSPYVFQGESQSPKDALCHVWLKLDQRLWRKRFHISSIYFRYFCFIDHISPWERARPFIWKKNNEYASIKDVLCQVWLKLAHWFWRRSFYNFVNVFPLFLYYLPNENGEGLHLNKFEFTFPYDALYEVLLKKRYFYLNGDLNSADVELAFI